MGNIILGSRFARNLSNIINLSNLLTLICLIFLFVGFLLEEHYYMSEL